MGVILIEGPDRCGKTTMAQALAEETGREFRFLPSPTVRPLIFSGEMNNPFLFFADAQKFWEESKDKNIVLDRDILSMLAYQGYLLNNMEPADIIHLYTTYVYKDNMPERIIYVINKPFAPYDENDPFEKHGYEAIRQAFEKAAHYLTQGFPELTIERVTLTKGKAIPDGLY